MDTLQLNKINELAREYLRLGIAKGSSDAVEKARFQLAFEKQHEEPKDSPYESLFGREQAESERETSERSEAREKTPSPLDARSDRFDALTNRVGSLENETQAKLRSQQSRIAQLEETIASLKREISNVSAQAMQSAQRAEAARERSNVPDANPAARDGPIASTIEQTIKGRSITSDDVAVDKIFYFGNR